MRYLLISFFRKTGGQIDEFMSVAKTIKTSDIQNSNIIMDFSLRKIEKCIIEGKPHDTTFDQLLKYYRSIYPQMIDRLEKESPRYVDHAKKT